MSKFTSVWACLWAFGEFIFCRKKGGRMKIIKQINSNAALAVDGSGREIVVLGRGVGFPKPPYELRDLSRIERTFYDVDPKHYRMITSLPHEILLASADLAEIAEDELDCTLNPNLPFTLADHLHFAMERLQQDIQILTPLAYDVEHLYPREYLLGCDALDILEQYTGVRLPESEAISVTLHILNAEIDKNDMHDTLMQIEILQAVDGIIREEMGIRLETSSFA